MSNPVNWFHITTKNVEGLGKFYGEAFDWKMSPGPGGMVFAETGAGGIPGGIAAPMDGSEASSIHIYVGTPDIDAQLARIERAGGKSAGFKHELPPGMGWISGFIDPAGNFVGLWQRPELPPAAPKKKAREEGRQEGHQEGREGHQEGRQGHQEGRQGREARQEGRQEGALTPAFLRTGLRDWPRLYEPGPPAERAWSPLLPPREPASCRAPEESGMAWA